MLQFRRTFQSEKHQLQELNNRLAQYLSRTKQLEQENACLITEINKLRQTNTTEWAQQRKAEMRDLRRMVGQLSFEKSQAEMEREKLWRELQMVQSLYSEETGVCRDIGGELKGCEKELHHAHKTNSTLEQRLFQLENEYKSVEETQRQEIAHLRRQVDSRVVPIITQTYHGPPAVTLEEVQEYARGLSEGWIETFEMYQKKVEEMEQSIRADQARLDDLQREKMLYAAEFDRLRAEAEKQGQIQMHLEEQLMHIQDKYRVDFNEYQVIIERLEHERNMMSDSIAEKLQEHQQLLQVKMDLGMEVAAYRALLEGERIDLPDAHRRINQHRRERIIDIKMPSQPYTPRASTSTRQHLDVRYMGQTSNQRRSPVPHSGSISPSRVIPISVTGRAQHQSPASRRDMVSFTKARAAAAASTTTKDKHVAQNENQSSQDVQKKAGEEKSVSLTENQFSPIISSTADLKSVKVVSPPMMSLGSKTEADSKMSDEKVSDEKEEKGNASESDFKGKDNIETKIGPSEKKILDSVSVEELIEKVMKPAGLDAKVSSSGESKITYHVEKTEQEDGTTKTQIVLESKVEEELDVSEDSALEELLCRGVKKVSLEDIKGTATGSMIQNLLSGLQGGENLENKSVNVEIIEEPIESHSDEEYEEEVEQKYMSKISQPSSTYFQIEELENVSHDSEGQRSDGDDLKTFMTDTGYGKGGYVQVHEVSRESEPPYLYQEPREYFVSTPDDNLSETEDGGGITSYGHYGIVDDLSDERYYQDEELHPDRLIAEESDEYKFMSSDHSFVKESFPECIIEEEVHVSPDVQESMLDFLKEDSLDPKEQLRGALEKIQDSVSGPLKEELAFLTRVSSASPQNLSVDVKKVQQSTDNGTTTIVAELNVSQTLEDSGLLEEDDLSEEQIVAALRSSNPGLEKAFQGGADGGYSLRVSRDQEVTHSEGLGGFTTKAESVTVITEKHTELGPSEESFTFQMDVNNSQGHAGSGQMLQSQMMDTPLQISHEKRVATVYLDTPIND